MLTENAHEQFDRTAISSKLQLRHQSTKILTDNQTHQQLCIWPLDNVKLENKILTLAHFLLDIGFLVNTPVKTRLTRTNSHCVCCTELIYTKQHFHISFTLVLMRVNTGGFKYISRIFYSETNFCHD